MTKPLQLFLKITLGLIGVFVLLWLALAAVVTYNKERLLSKITTQLNNNINGKLTIERMEPALIQGFPGLSVSLHNVLLRDSLYHEHKHDLLRAREIYLALNVFSLISGNTVIQKLTVQDGTIYFYTDKNGRSNNKILTAGSNSGSKEKGNRKKIKSIELRNVTFIQKNDQRNKLFHFDIRSASVNLSYKTAGWTGRLKSELMVRSFAFKRQKGSFLKNQILKTNLKLHYDIATGVLDIPMQDISIGKQSFEIGGNFKSTATASDFKLTIISQGNKLEEISRLLPNNISGKLNAYSLAKPLFAKAILQGSLKARGDPKILIAWRTDNNDLSVFNERIKNCSFTGYFDNEVKKGQGFNDANTVIGFANVKGTYYNIPFVADTIRVINLKRPIFEGRFKSDFTVNRLNAVSGASSFRFQHGRASLNVFYRAPYNKSASVEPFIYGNLKLNDVSLVYNPRNLEFSGIDGLIRFNGQDLLLKNFNVKTGGSTFYMQGSLANFLNFYYADPSRVQVDWHIQTPSINLQQFISFLGRRRASTARSAGNAPAAKIFIQLDRILDEASAHLELKAQKLEYRKFQASNVRSSIVLKKTGVELQTISLKHADGTLNMKGEIEQNTSVNRFKLLSAIRDVALHKLFYAFENFGQDGITYQNLRGQLFSNTSITGLIDSKGKLVPNSIKGKVEFDIKNGMLLNFEPMERIGKFAFPNRNFSAINFNKLKNSLDIKGNKIYVRPMYIESSVLNLFVEGTYGIPTGTNMAIRIPLRNPKRDEGLSDSLKRERFDNGIVINLQALDDENGNVKFKLGKTDEIKEREKIEKEKEKLAKERDKNMKKEERKEEKGLQ